MNLAWCYFESIRELRGAYLDHLVLLVILWMHPVGGQQWKKYITGRQVVVLCADCHCDMDSSLDGRGG